MGSAWLAGTVCGRNREKYISFEGLTCQARWGSGQREGEVLFSYRHREPWRAFSCALVPIFYIALFFGEGTRSEFISL